VEREYAVAAVVVAAAAAAAAVVVAVVAAVAVVAVAVAEAAADVEEVVVRSKRIETLELRMIELRYSVEVAWFDVTAELRELENRMTLWECDHAECQPKNCAIHTLYEIHLPPFSLADLLETHPWHLQHRRHHHRRLYQLVRPHHLSVYSAYFGSTKTCRTLLMLIEVD
jgi:hypothetical protein